MLDHRPKKLYKYFSPQRWTFFQDLRLRYSQFGAFNDPFEGRPEITGLTGSARVHGAVEEALTAAVQDIYNELSEEQKKVLPLDKIRELVKSPESMATVASALADAMKSKGSALVDKIDQSLGTLCLCEERYNLLMWAHYAESHSGFQLEFDSSLITEDKDGKGGGALFRVCYQERRPSGALDELTQTEIMLSKSSHWSYEREWRIMRKLADAAMTISATPYPICLFDVLPKAVTGIVFGARMDGQIESRIREAIRCNDELAHVRLFRAQPDDSHYFLNYVAA